MNEMIFKEKYNDFSTHIEKYRDKFAAIIPDGLNFDIVKSSIESEFVKNPDLLLCSQRSIIYAIKTVVNVGLVPNSNTGQCYFIPFKNSKLKEKDLNVIIGYRGLVDLMYRSGLVKKIEVKAVFKGDNFDYSFGLNQELKHRPNGNVNKDDLTHVYCIIELATGGVLFDVMNRVELTEFRDSSANYKYAKKNKHEEKTIWSIHFVEMCKKTILRRMSKIVPLSIEVRNIIGFDEKTDIGTQNIKSDSYKDNFFKEDAFNEVEEAEIVTNIIEVKNDKIKELNNLKKAATHDVTVDSLNQLTEILKRRGAN